MTQQQVELIGSYWTLAGGAYPHTDREYSPWDFRERVEAAARVGFKGLGIWHADLIHVQKKRSLREMKKILDDNGMTHIELEFIFDWFLEGEKKKKSDELRNLLLTAAEALHANHVKVGDFFNTPCPMPKLLESFAELCEDAEDYGTKIAFEMMPFANVHTLEDTLALVEGAGANGGIILDLWHIVRMGIPYEELKRIPISRLIGVELNDGDMKVEGDLHLATINNRKLCGEGEFDVRGFIQCLFDMGYRGAWGIEVLNAEMREWPMDRLFTQSFETTMAQFRNIRTPALKTRK
ncbi:MAG: sugar phosphate isomerase/epimerase [Gammaproteobacteria bacterium]|nr:sugar phosphate isomerase/epimerase [Gammaproteobacteria bacterium]